jgi:hypothetical protein
MSIWIWKSMMSSGWWMLWIATKLQKEEFQTRLQLISKVVQEKEEVE